MNVLVLGSGGREHAIAWKIKQSKNCETLYCLPGNPGTAQISTNLAGSVNDFEAVKAAVLENNVSLCSCVVSGNVRNSLRVRKEYLVIFRHIVTKHIV